MPDPAMPDPAMPDPAMPDPAIPEDPLPSGLRFLKFLVIVLTVAMIGGVITVVGLLVTRMPQSFTAVPLALPESIHLPEGAKASAVTFGKGWIAVVTEDDRILIFGREGDLRQDIKLVPAPGP